MAISEVRIKNYKSLKNIIMKFDNESNINCLFGKNGVGKSNILDAMNYFYNNLSQYNLERDIIDKSNPYVYSMEISVLYDVDRIYNILSEHENCFIKEELESINKYIVVDKNTNKKMILLKLIQNKDNILNFIPNDKKLLKFIYRYFPIYFFDTRFISLQNWDIIWGMIAEITQTNLKINHGEVISELDSTYKNIYGEMYIKTVKSIEEIFKSENIDINKYNYNERYKNILISRLAGNEFIKEGNKLKYYSDGLNSLNFLKLTLKLIFKLSENGLKEPIVIVDEIEIGLHPQYIIKLVKIITETINKWGNVIISTHSPVLIAELIKCTDLVHLYRVDMFKNISKIEKMQEIVSNEDRDIFTINESYCYFANKLVFVEGASEMQLFSHKKIVKLYSFLDEIDIYCYDSNNTKLNFIYPDKTKFDLPYLVLVDMDKILSYKKSKKFIIKKESLVNPLCKEKIKRKEKFLYYSEHKRKTYSLRNKIESKLKECKFEFDKDKLGIYNKKYDELIKEIQRYCLNYNVYPVTTTLEGLLINNSNVNIFIKWIEKEIVGSDALILKNILEYNKDNSAYYTEVLRVICNGKFNNLKTLKEVEGTIDKDLLKNIKYLNGKIGKKTGGWIIKFIDFYFDENIDDSKGVNVNREIFRKCFPELDCILKIIRDMV